MERLSDLDELILRCRSEQAKEYISEAVACYRGSAYRACIVTTWIAVVFDIIDKLGELSLSGNGQARRLFEDFQRYQENVDRGDETSVKPALEFEKKLLERAQNDLQLIDAQQFRDLSRLREDRHRCAHPTFQKTGVPYKPSAELARSHLRNAIEYLLQNPPVQGRAALEELKHLVGSAYFPKKVPEARTSLEESVFKRPNEALVRGFVDTLVFGLFEKGSPLRFKAETVAALGAVVELQRAEAAPRLGVQLTKLASKVEDEDFRGFLAILGTVNDAWSYLDEPARNKVREFVLSAAFDQFSSVVRFIEQVEALQDALESRLASLSLEELSEVISKGVKAKCVPRALQLFSTVGSWNRANAVAEAVILPLITDMTASDVEMIVRAPKENKADLLGSGGYSRFLRSALENGLITPERIAELGEEQALNTAYILGEE